MLHRAYRFAEALRTLLRPREAADIDALWTRAQAGPLGWDALAGARRSTHPGWIPVLDEIDGLLLRLLDRLPPVVRRGGRAAARLRQFRLPELERLQHAAAAALVAHRYGAAGLATVTADGAAPLARRYFAFLTLAEQHPAEHWPMFSRYLIPEAHHAFLGTAAEAARYYPDEGAARALVALFGSVRADLHLRAFLSPRILASLFVLSDTATLPFFRDLLITGHTASESDRCEVTRALVMVRRFTGRLEPNTKFGGPPDATVRATIDRAEKAFESKRDELSPVAVI